MSAQGRHGAYAFPVVLPGFMGRDAPIDGEIEAEGLTIREYFAARAPHDIPDWFEPVMRPRPLPPAASIEALSNFKEAGLNRGWPIDRIQRQVDNWRHDPCYSLADVAAPTLQEREVYERARPLLVLYEERWTEFREADSEWQIERQEARVGQWPWAWADLVLQSATSMPGNGETSSLTAGKDRQP